MNLFKLKHLRSQFTVLPGQTLFVALIWLFILFVLILFSCSVDNFLFNCTGVSVLSIIGTGPSLGPHKLSFFKMLIVSFIVINVLTIAILPKPNKILLLVFVTGMACLYAISVITVYHPILPHTFIERIKVQNLPIVDYENIFSKRYMLESKIESFDDLHKFSKQRYALHRNYLRSRWGIDDEEKLKAIFFMVLVSYMWGYDNKNDYDNRGSVLSNEENGYGKRHDGQITVKSYINSNIGSCLDTGNILKYLLDKEKIENTLVRYAGHVMNEVRCGDGWYTFDSVTNIVFYTRFNNLPKDGNREIVMTILPHNNLVYKDNAFYRTRTGQIFLDLLLKAITGTMNPREELALPAYIK